MGERKIHDLWNDDQDDIERDWQEKIAWLKLMDSLQQRQRSTREGWMGGIEQNPLVWAFVFVVLGGLSFFLATRILF